VYATDFNAATVDNLRHNIELNEAQSSEKDCVGKAHALMMNWKDESTWPTTAAASSSDNTSSSHEKTVDYVVGSDLIYQCNMVPLLVSTIRRLLRRSSRARFWYVAPDQDGAPGQQRQGHGAFLRAMADHFTVATRKAPTEYGQNPLESQDDEECFLHFHDLQSTSYILYEFRWKEQECVDVLDPN